MSPLDVQPPSSTSGGLTDAELRATDVPVEQGTAAAAGSPWSIRLSDGAAFYNAPVAGQLPAALAAGGGLKVEGVAGGVAQPVSGTVTASGPLTDAQLAARLPLSVEQATSVDVADGGGSLTVDGPVTDTQIRATPLPVSGTVTTGGLTDTQIRATPLPVSGTVTASGPLTDTQLRASAVSVEQATSVAVTQDQPAATTGSLTGAAQTVVIPVAGYASCSVQIFGTYAGLILQFEASNDGTNYASVQGRNANSQALSSLPTPGTNASVMYLFDCVGYTHLRVSSFSGPSSGSCSVVAKPSAASYVAVGSVVADTELAASISLADGMTNPTTALTGALALGWNGASWDRVRNTTTAVSVTNVAASATSVTLIAANTARRAATIVNDGTSTLFAKYGSSATTTNSYTVKLPPGAVWELPQPIFVSTISGIWTATGGNGALCSEVT